MTSVHEPRPVFKFEPERREWLENYLKRAETMQAEFNDPALFGMQANVLNSMVIAMAERIVALEKRSHCVKTQVIDLEWSKAQDNTVLSSPVCYQIWSDNGGSGAPDDPYLTYENFAVFDPNMILIFEVDTIEDGKHVAQEHFDKFVKGLVK